MAYNPAFPSTGNQAPVDYGYGATIPQSLQPGRASGTRATDTNVNFEGAQFRIAYRDSNSLLSIRLPPDYEIKAKPGAMVAMDASAKIRGKVSCRYFRQTGHVTNR